MSKKLCEVSKYLENLSASYLKQMCYFCILYLYFFGLQASSVYFLPSLHYRKLLCLVNKVNIATLQINFVSSIKFFELSIKDGLIKIRFNL